MSLVAVRPPLRLLRLGNPFVRRILRSRAHPLLSGTLAILQYEGHTTGQQFSIPLRYAESADGRFVTLAVDPARKLWWRSFAEPRSAALVVRGQLRLVVGTLAQGSLREEARAAYRARYPRSAPLIDEAALVVFERPG